MIIYINIVHYLSLPLSRPFHHCTSSKSRTNLWCHVHDRTSKAMDTRWPLYYVGNSGFFYNTFNIFQLNNKIICILVCADIYIYFIFYIAKININGQRSRWVQKSRGQLYEYTLIFLFFIVTFALSFVLFSAYRTSVFFRAE